MNDSDYTFLSIGKLYEIGIDVMNAAGKRFGANMANCVYNTGWGHYRKYGTKSLDLEIFNECLGIELSAGDVSFLEKIYEAEQLIRTAQELFLGAIEDTHAEMNAREKAKKEAAEKKREEDFFISSLNTTDKESVEYARQLFRESRNE